MDRGKNTLNHWRATLDALNLMVEMNKKLKEENNQLDMEKAELQKQLEQK